jgi:hypothetical protein
VSGIFGLKRSRQVAVTLPVIMDPPVVGAPGQSPRAG